MTSLQQDLTLRCVSCGTDYAARMMYRCPGCGGILEVIRPKPDGGRWEACHFVRRDVTLGEGNTPLREMSPKLLDYKFRGRLLVKDETRNPSGSFKDRLVAAALSQALDLGAKGVVSASSGNAGAAAACYAANAGIPAVICCPEATPHGKLAQILAYGATLERVPGHYGKSYWRAIELCEENGYANLTTTYLNPYGVDALRLVGQEIAEAMDEKVPDWISIPTSSGPLVKGVFQGFGDRGGRIPKIVAAQSEGCAPIARAFSTGAAAVEAWDDPWTIASGIADPLTGYPEDGSHTLSLIRASCGKAVAVPDEEIKAAMVDLARQAGIFCEPTGAVSLAASRRLFLNDAIKPTETIVCIVTGHGFKDFSAWSEAGGRSQPALA